MSKPTTVRFVWQQPTGSGRRTGWARIVTGLDRTKKGAKALLGEYLHDGEEIDLPAGTLVVEIKPCGSVKNGFEGARICRVNADGELEPCPCSADGLYWDWRKQWLSIADAVEAELLASKPAPVSVAPPAPAPAYVLLVSWQSGDVDKLEIPLEPWPGLGCPLVEVGPRDQEPAAGSITLYAPNTRTVIGKVLVHGDEVPEMLVCTAPEVIPSLSAERRSLLMCPKCHPVTCQEGTIVVEPLGTFTPTHQLRATYSDKRVETYPCRTGDTLTIGPAGSYEREFSVHDPDDRDARVTVRVRGEAPRMVLLSVEALKLTAEACNECPDDPYDRALQRIREKRTAFIAAMSLVEAGVMRARTMSRVEAVRVLDSAATLEYDATGDCDSVAIVLESFPDEYTPESLTPLDEARRVLAKCSNEVS